MTETRIDPTAAPSAPVAKPPALTPGWKTSEFWLHLGVGMALSGLTSFCALSETLPPIPKAVALAVCPVAIAWLTKVYNDGRVELKAGGKS